MKRIVVSGLLAAGVLCGNPAMAQEEKMKSDAIVLKHIGAETIEAAIAKVVKECNEGKIESTYTTEIQNDALHACLSHIVFGRWGKRGSPPSSPPWDQPQLLQEARMACKKRYEQVLKAVTDLDPNHKDWTSELKELKRYADGEDKEMRRYFWSAGNGDCNSIIGLERHFCKVKTGNRILSTRPDFRKFDDWVLAADPADEPGLPRLDESVRKAGTAKTVDLGGVKLELAWIPAGEFMMGSRKGEVGRFVIEPRRRVKLTKGFWMGKYEVTQEQ